MPDLMSDQPRPETGGDLSWITERLAQLSENELLMVKAVLDDIAAGRPVKHFPPGTRVHVASYGTVEFIVQGTAPYYESNGVVTRKVEVRSKAGRLHGFADPNELTEVPQ